MCILDRNLVVVRDMFRIGDINFRSDINTIEKTTFIVTANFVPLYCGYKYVSFEMCFPKFANPRWYKLILILCYDSFSFVEKRVLLAN